jgi:hypothetical protein
MRLKSFKILATWWQNLFEDEAPWHPTHELNRFESMVVPVHAVKTYVSVEVQPNQFLPRFRTEVSGQPHAPKAVRVMLDPSVSNL